MQPIAGKPAPTGIAQIWRLALYLWELACRRWAAKRPPAIQWAKIDPPSLPTIFSGLIRNRANAGNNHSAPNMFHNNMKVSISPMSAWNLIAEKIQVHTPMARHNPVNSTALPVERRVS
ncbi:hypothetical protein D3C79_951710 [compost metagenome]